MTPQELYEALEARRLEDGLTQWQVAVDLDISEKRLSAMRRGELSAPLRRRVEAWLEIRRHTGPPRKE